MESNTIVVDNTISLEEVHKINPTHIVISPGPGHPKKDTGTCIPIIKEFGPEIPILGVCLGHQAIVEAFGGKVIRGYYPIHGKASAVHHDGKGIFRNIPNPFLMGRYHSLVADLSTLPNCLEVSAKFEDGAIAGIRHKKYPIEGTQGHPESYLTDPTIGKQILRNFLAL